MLAHTNKYGRFNGEIGDVVVGRITEVAQKRWRVDTQSRLDAVLTLASVNLPGGVLVRGGGARRWRVAVHGARGVAPMLWRASAWRWCPAVVHGGGGARRASWV